MLNAQQGIVGARSVDALIKVYSRLSAHLKGLGVGHLSRASAIAFEQIARVVRTARGAHARLLAPMRDAAEASPCAWPCVACARLGERISWTDVPVAQWLVVSDVSAEAAYERSNAQVPH